MAPFFMDEVQLPQGYSHFEEAVYFLPLSSQKFPVLILSTWERWKTESTLEPPSGFEHGTPGLGVQRLNHLAIAPLAVLTLVNLVTVLTLVKLVCSKTFFIT